MLVRAVFGDPVEHSLSPAMQNAAFSAMGLSARRLAFRVRRERLRDAILGGLWISPPPLGGEGQTVFDIVYNRETELLLDAANAGARLDLVSEAAISEVSSSS